MRGCLPKASGSALVFLGAVGLMKGLVCLALDIGNFKKNKTFHTYEQTLIGYN